MLFAGSFLQVLHHRLIDWIFCCSQEKTLPNSRIILDHRGWTKPGMANSCKHNAFLIISELKYLSRRTHGHRLLEGLLVLGTWLLPPFPCFHASNLIRIADKTQHPSQVCSNVASDSSPLSVTTSDSQGELWMFAIPRLCPRLCCLQLFC